MSRFRKIDVRIHGDQKFRNLSAPCPCGRYLWFYLLTGPHTISIPGLACVGEAALAEALRWPMKAFREAFQEVFREGMAEADWEARVLWIPRAIFYNPPESPNVIKSWAAYWDEIPECALKVKAYHHFKGFLEGFAKAFQDSFGKACGKPMANQEQEQEQEQKQEQEHPPTPLGGATVAKGGKEIPIPPNLDTDLFRGAWTNWLRHRQEIKKPMKPTQTAQLLGTLSLWGAERAIRAIEYTIAKGWVGLAEPDAPGGGRSPFNKPSAKDVFDQLEREEQERCQRQQHSASGPNGTPQSSALPTPEK